MVLNLPSKPKTDIDYDEGEHSPLAERGDMTAVAPKQLPAAIVNKLSAILIPENLPGPAKLIYRPILLVAVGIHAFFLFMPQGKEAKKPPEQKEKPITISQVATGKATTKVPTTKLPSAKITPPKPTLPRVNIPSPTAPTLPNPKPKAEDKPPEATTPTPDRPLPDVKPNQDVTPAPPGGGAKAGDPFQDFVHHPSAQAGCYELSSCMKVAGNPMSMIADFFKAKLGEKKFDLNQSVNDADRQVYEVTKGGITKIITIMSDGSDVVYILGEAAIPSLSSLKDANEVPAEVISSMGSIAGGAPDESDFTEASKYVTVSEVENESGDEGMVVSEFNSAIVSMNIIPHKQPGEVFAYMEPTLLQSFKGGVKKIGEFGGGPLYELNNGKSNFYLNIVPRKNPATDSISVMFNQSPI
jgi:hypothetical protein